MGYVCRSRGAPQQRRRGRRARGFARLGETLHRLHWFQSGGPRFAQSRPCGPGTHVFCGKGRGTGACCGQGRCGGSFEGVVVTFSCVCVHESGWTARRRMIGVVPGRVRCVCVPHAEPLSRARCCSGWASRERRGRRRSVWQHPRSTWTATMPLTAWSCESVPAPFFLRRWLSLV